MPIGAAIGKKRNKLSFVCQSCRKSKTKCDKQKPSCSRCLRLGHQCIYDLELQPTPKNPSKDATITRLQKELEYWKSQVMAEIGSNRETTGSPVSKRQKLDQYTTAPDPHNVIINFSNMYPRLVIRSTKVRDLKPLAKVSQIRQDRFLSVFIASIFVASFKNSLLQTAFPETMEPINDSQVSCHHEILDLQNKLLKRCKNYLQQTRILEFTNYLTVGTEVPKKHQSGFFIKLFSNLFCRTGIEDSCTSARYSKPFQDLVLRGENVLPCLEAIKMYKIHFYRYIYPIVPFMDISLFEDCLATLLQKDPENPQKVKINMGTDDSKYKLANISMLLVVLKITNISMDIAYANSKGSLNSFDDNFDSILMEENRISDEAIVVAQLYLAKLNIFHSTNEIHICCMMYIWFFFLITQEDGDMLFGSSTDVFLGFVATLASNTGLTRDPSQYRQFKLKGKIDPRMSNFRRKLGLCVLLIGYYATPLTGKHPQLMDSYIKNFVNINRGRDSYMDLVRGDMESPDSFNLKIHASVYKGYQLCRLQHELDRITRNPQKDPSLAEIEILLERFQVILDNHFSIFGLESGDSSRDIEILKTREGSIEIDMGFVDHSNSFERHIIVRMELVMITSTLFLYFENQCGQERSEYMPYYEKYFSETVKQTLQLTKIIEKYYRGDFEHNLPDFMRFSLELKTQNGFSTIIYSHLALILRINHAESLLVESMSEDALKAGDSASRDENEERLQILRSLKEDFEHILTYICQLLNKDLRFTLFSTFRTLLFFDAILKIIKKDQTLNVMNKILNPLLLAGKKTSEFRDSMLSCMGIDISKSSQISESLKHSNFLTTINISHLREAQNIIYAMGYCSKDASNEYHNFASGDISGLDKLSSISTIQQPISPSRDGAPHLSYSEIRGSSRQIPGEGFLTDSTISMDLFGIFDYDSTFKR